MREGWMIPKGHPLRRTNERRMGSSRGMCNHTEGCSQEGVNLQGLSLAIRPGATTRVSSTK
ncbi:hypothetical protein CJ030_MR7G000004 [Morella rubra]|uniref:Uncharacterized protein n=1 Tax=Morella rubra TaxID=262757 RepID=A0A6A1V5L9_9ROSI|nr:hypothetical protein CJ030_MR7G000004 [Morella rubra]